MEGLDRARKHYAGDPARTRLRENVLIHREVLHQQPPPVDARVHAAVIAEMDHGLDFPISEQGLNRGLIQQVSRPATDTGSAAPGSIRSQHPVAPGPRGIRTTGSPTARRRR